jgi:hypothetical protein
MIKGHFEEKKKYFKKWSENCDDDTIGIFFRAPTFLPQGESQTYIGECYGIIFLNEQNLTFNVIIHECLHSSLAHERDIERYKMDYGDDTDIEHEERFAYYHGWLAAEVLRVLKENKYGIR